MTAAEAATFPARVLGRRKRGLRGSTIANMVFLTMVALFVAVPLYVMVVTSFKTLDQIAEGQVFSLPREWTLSGWWTAWAEVCAGLVCEGVRNGFFASLKILFPSLILSISLSCVTGYALALWNVRWANTFLFILFLCAFVPFQVVMIPLVIMVSSMGLFGTVWAIALVHAVLSMPLLTLIFRNYYKDIPAELINAAIMDSGSFWQIFFKVVLPMSANIMIVVLILMVTSIWNDFLIGLTFGGLGAQPMTVILANTVVSQFGPVKYNVDMAAALLTAIPPLVVYFALGKFFVQGITAGAIKG